MQNQLSTPDVTEEEGLALDDMNGEHQQGRNQVNTAYRLPPPNWLVFWPRHDLEFLPHPTRDGLVRAALFIVNMSPDYSVAVKVKAPERAAETISASPPCLVLLSRQSRKISFFSKRHDLSNCTIRVDMARCSPDLPETEVSSYLKMASNDQQAIMWTYNTQLSFSNCRNLTLSPSNENSLHLGMGDRPSMENGVHGLVSHYEDMASAMARDNRNCARSSHMTLELMPSFVGEEVSGMLSPFPSSMIGSSVGQGTSERVGGDSHGRERSFGMNQQYGLPHGMVLSEESIPHISHNKSSSTRFPQSNLSDGRLANSVASNGTMSNHQRPNSSDCVSRPSNENHLQMPMESLIRNGDPRSTSLPTMQQIVQCSSESITSRRNVVVRCSATYPVIAVAEGRHEVMYRADKSQSAVTTDTEEDGDEFMHWKMDMDGHQRPYEVESYNSSGSKQGVRLPLSAPKLSTSTTPRAAAGSSTSTISPDDANERSRTSSRQHFSQQSYYQGESPSDTDESTLTPSNASTTGSYISAKVLFRRSRSLLPDKSHEYQLPMELSMGCYGVPVDDPHYHHYGSRMSPGRQTGPTQGSHGHDSNNHRAIPSYGSRQRSSDGLDPGPSFSRSAPMSALSRSYPDGYQHGYVDEDMVDHTVEKYGVEGRENGRCSISGSDMKSGQTSKGSLLSAGGRDGSQHCVSNHSQRRQTCGRETADHIHVTDGEAESQRTDLSTPSREIVSKRQESKLESRRMVFGSNGVPGGPILRYCDQVLMDTFKKSPNGSIQNGSFSAKKTPLDTADENVDQPLDKSKTTDEQPSKGTAISAEPNCSMEQSSEVGSEDSGTQVTVIRLGDGRGEDSTTKASNVSKKDSESKPEADHHQDHIDQRGEKASASTECKHCISDPTGLLPSRTYPHCVRLVRPTMKDCHADGMHLARNPYENSRIAAGNACRPYKGSNGTILASVSCTGTPETRTVAHWKPVASSPALTDTKSSGSCRCSDCSLLRAINADETVINNLLMSDTDSEVFSSPPQVDGRSPRKQTQFSSSRSCSYLQQPTFATFSDETVNCHHCCSEGHPSTVHAKQQFPLSGSRDQHSHGHKKSSSEQAMSPTWHVLLDHKNCCADGSSDTIFTHPPTGHRSVDNCQPMISSTNTASTISQRHLVEESHPTPWNRSKSNTSSMKRRQSTPHMTCIPESSKTKPYVASIYDIRTATPEESLRLTAMSRRRESFNIGDHQCSQPPKELDSKKPVTSVFEVIKEFLKEKLSGESLSSMIPGNLVKKKMAHSKKVLQKQRPMLQDVTPKDEEPMQRVIIKYCIKGSLAFLVISSVTLFVYCCFEEHFTRRASRSAAFWDF